MSDVAQPEKYGLTGRARGGLISGLGAALALLLVALIPTSAQAVNWYTWRSGATAKVRTWYGVQTGAQYNRARVTTFYDSQAAAYVSIAGVGTSSAGQEVNVTFSYRTVNASCMWDGVMIGDGSIGLLNCYLGY